MRPPRYTRLGPPAAPYLRALWIGAALFVAGIALDQVSENTRRLLSDLAAASLAERPAVPLKGKTEAVALYGADGAAE